MNIISAKFANEQNDAVEVQTAETGSAIICLPPYSDNIRGGQETYAAWVASGGLTDPYDAPAAPPVDFIALAEAHIGKYFSPFILLDGFKRIMTATATQTLASIPKTVATAEWAERVKQTAMTGSTDFPEPDFTVAEVLTE